MTSLVAHIESFLQNTTSNPLIVIFGPTASGKTSLSLDVAELVGGEIISVDARQIYRYMDIGTGKIRPYAMRNIAHHLLDICDPSQAFSVVNYRQKALPRMGEIWARGNVPILCGGTGLYLDALLFERHYLGNPPDTQRRAELEAYRLTHGNEALWQKLFALDPEYAKELHPNNHTYIIRGIEVFESTGQSKHTPKHIPTLLFPTLFLTPYQDTPENRSTLYEVINHRVDVMVQEGLFAEVRSLLKQYVPHAPGLNTIGYRESVQFLCGNISEEEAIGLIKQHSRQYAKRQITWNKKYHLYHPYLHTAEAP